ncbi:MAG: hypothetical protein M1832_002617 [Thelocarpon impressellum]|nr:MAG: hypothetical protein M1832_002617 [Thelocarpon impressellum]
MATPTPSKTAPLSQAMTPGSFANQLAAFSPLPTIGMGSKSVAPSPAYLSKKSPSNATTAAAGLHHHTGSTYSGTGGGGPLNFDSPSAAALGLSLGMGLPTLESVTSGNVRGDDEERRRRIEAILGMLRTRPGRVSEEGVERLAKRTGLEYLWEGQAGSSPRMLSIAGSGVLIDVNFDHDAVTSVAISFLKSPDSPTVPAPKAAEILMKELRPRPGSTSLDTSLTPFAAHLERLARLDKLSSPGINCFEAISGIYASLRRLYDWERRRVVESLGPGQHSEDAVEKEVLCKRSGRPVMHARGRVGLSLEYWMRRRAVTSAGRTEGAVSGTKDSGEEEPVTWAAVIECEYATAGLFPSVRVSEDWISENVEKAADQQHPLFGDSGQVAVDWLEPPSTLLADSGTDAMAVDSGAPNMGKLPNVRFVARLEPPVVVPLAAAYEIFMTAGGQPQQEAQQATTFDGLLLPGSGDSSSRESDNREIRRDRRVTVYGADGEAQERLHRHTLYVQKQDYGRTIEEIPFSHPRQLVAILPILRQYALLSSIVHNTLSPSNERKWKESPSHQSPASPPADDDIVEETNAPPEDAELAALMSDSEAADGEAALPVDLGLSTQPTPRLTLFFPQRTGGKLLSAAFEVYREGGVGLVAQNFIHGDSVADDEADEKGKGKGKQLTVAGVAKALETCEDLGILAEWLCRRLD